MATATALYIDIDFYLTLCTRMGVESGHKLLKSVGWTLKSMFHDSGISCHVRRDEFAVFIARVPRRIFLMSSSAFCAGHCAMNLEKMIKSKYRQVWAL